MKRIISVLLIVVALFIASHASITTIQGIITGGSTKSIRLIQYTDFLTGLRKTLAIANVDQNGGFMLHADLSETTWAMLAFGFQEGEICLQPGQVYEVKIEIQAGQKGTSFFDRSPLMIIFVKDDKDLLNNGIQEFNIMYNDFIINNAESLYRPGKKELFETFRSQVSGEFGNISNQYLRDYIRYKEASMEQFMKLKSRESLAREYLIGQQVLYNNVEYFYFFSQFFDKYFLAGNRYISYAETEDMINENMSARQILDTLDKDPVLKDDYMKELVLLSSLKELYKTAGFKKPNILALAGQIKDQSMYESNRKIASNLVQRLNWLQPGTLAPEFILTGTDGTVHRSSDFKGKYTYLGFIISKSPSCQVEIDQQSQLYNDFGDKVNFVSISADQDINTLKDYTREKNISWTVLHYDDDYDLLDRYDVRTFPIYLLIDPSGKIYCNPTPTPTENIRQMLEGIKEGTGK